MEDSMLFTRESGRTGFTIESKGAELCSFRIDGKEYIWQADPKVWGQHSPILFPVVGAIKDDRISIAGKEYGIRKHGFIAFKKFSLKDEGPKHVTLSRTEDEETLKSYPFRFELSVTYDLKEDGFETTFGITNNSSSDMPFCLGAHPGFICPMEDGLSFEDYELVFDPDTDNRIAVCPDGMIVKGERAFEDMKDGRIPLRHEWFDENDALIFPHVKTKKVALVSPKGKEELTMEFDSFDVMSIWTRPGMRADYVCLEPWAGINQYEDEPSVFEQKKFATILAPGSSKKLSYRVRFSRLRA